MELFPYEVKPKIYLGKTLKGIRTKKFEQMFSKNLVIKLQRLPLPIYQPVEVEVEELIITADEVKPEIDIISSNEVDLSTHTSVLQSNSYFLRTRETKRRKYTDIDENDELTLKIYSNYLEKIPVLRIEKLSHEFFTQALQRLEELKQNMNTQTDDQGPLLDQNGIILIKQEIYESQKDNLQTLVEKPSFQLKIGEQMKKKINADDDAAISDYSSSGSSETSSSSETEDEFKPVKKKYKKKFAGYIHKRKLVKCHICSREFDRRAKLVLHIETHQAKANREKNAICQVCKKGFYNDYLLSNHIKWAHNENDKGQEFLCPHCGKIFEKRRHFHAHLTSHLQEYKCEHENCGQVFKQKMYLKIHQQLHREDKSQIKCEKCSRKFSSKRSLDNHNLRMHIDIEIMNCTFEGCGKSFKGKHKLENHQKTHGEPSIKCKYCKLLYRSKKAISQHMLLKHQDKLNFDHKCTFENCSRSFTSSLHLARHLKEHKDVNKPKKRWLCTQCGKPFKTKEHLANHQISHGSDKNFKCPHDGCGKVFKYPAHSRTHFRIEHEMNDEERAQYFKEAREKRSAKAKQSKGKETNKEKN